MQMTLGLCKTECGLDQGRLAWGSKIPQQHVEGKLGTGVEESFPKNSLTENPPSYNLYLCAQPN